MASEYDALLEEDTRKPSEYDALLTPPPTTSEAPQPKLGLADMLFDQETAQNLRGAIQDVVYSIPGMVAQIPKMAYQGLKFVAGGPQVRTQVGEEALTEAIIQGRQMAKDVQAPLGSRESFRGIANLGLMAAPALGEALGEAALLGKKPPIQTEVIPKGGEINAIKKGIIPESSIEKYPGDGEGGPPAEAGGGGGVEPSPEVQGTQEVATVPPEQLKSAYPSLTPEDITKLDSMTSEQANSEAARAMEARDDLIKSGATQGSQEYQRANDYASAVLDKAQQGGLPKPEQQPPAATSPEVLPAEETPAMEVKSLTQDSTHTEVGPNVKGFETVYGPGEIKPGESIAPEEIFRSGQADLASGKDPYAIADRARTGDVSPKEIGLLTAEHDRLLHEAAASEGTPEYEEKYQVAKDFAQNMLKPAGTKWHQTGMGLQVKAPVDLSNLTGFRSAFEERFNKEMTPTQAQSFSKIAGDVARAKAEDLAELGRTSDRVQQRFKGVKDIAFDDAVKSLHDVITTALKECNL